MSPSSSDSYSVLAMSSNSCVKPLAVKNLGTMTISCSEEEVADASPFHPRYNTPESQLHDDVASDVRTSRSSFRCRDMEAIKEPTIVEMASTESVTSRAKCVEFETWPCGRLITRW